jgi:hypothetical protein
MLNAPPWTSSSHKLRAMADAFRVQSKIRRWERLSFEERFGMLVEADTPRGRNRSRRATRGEGGTGRHAGGVQGGLRIPLDRKKKQEILPRSRPARTAGSTGCRNPRADGCRKRPTSMCSGQRSLSPLHRSEIQSAPRTSRHLAIGRGGRHGQKADRWYKKVRFDPRRMDADP